MRLTTLAACALLIAAGANTASAQQRLTDQVMKDARTYGTKTEAELREDRIKLEKFEAVFKEGKALQDAGDVAGAIRIFEEASSAGWADATWRLSSLYEKGRSCRVMLTRPRLFGAWPTSSARPRQRPRHRKTASDKNDSGRWSSKAKRRSMQVT